MKITFTFLLSSIALFCFSQENYLLIGTYTSGKSEGLYVYKFNSQTGEAKFINTAKASNPSFLTISPNQKFVYAVNENADSTRFTVTGHVAAYSFNKANGKLNYINKQESGGKHPCYVAIDKTGKWIIAGNYSSGSLSVLPVKPNGSLDTAIQIVQHEGHGVVEGRQDDPHVHATVLSKDNKTLYVPDLGIDKLMMYKFNNKTGLLTDAPMPFVMTEPGTGPRHFDFHPNNKFAYLVEELTGTVSVFEIYKDGSLESIQNISALPRDFEGAIGSADIHVSADGKFLYVSNRGESNTIGIFKINSSTGLLTWIDYQSTLGKTPRNFSLDPSGNFLLVANQNTDDIIIFKRNKNTGLLTDTGKKINVPSPVCLKWISTK